jgi:hypothetical protein
MFFEEEYVSHLQRVPWKKILTIFVPPFLGTNRGPFQRADTSPAEIVWQSRVAVKDRLVRLRGRLE